VDPRLVEGRALSPGGSTVHKKVLACIDREKRSS
jgi:hypothetical protein